MKHTIVLNNVSKQIKDVEILKDINVKLETGKVYGFIGKNGSGKTMILRLIAGLIKADKGEMQIDGKAVEFNSRYPLSVGIIIENAGLYKEFTGKENLKFLASIKGIIGEKEIEYALSRVGLDPNDKRTVRKYSLGMRQRLIFAQAIMEKTDILLLDEPTNALDKDGVNLIRKIILEEKERGTLICLASHNEEDIGILCDETYKIETGKILKHQYSGEQNEI